MPMQIQQHRYKKYEQLKSQRHCVKININLLTILGLSIGYSRGKVVPLHAVKAYGGMEARFHSFLTSELDKS